MKNSITCKSFISAIMFIAISLTFISCEVHYDAYRCPQQLGSVYNALINDHVQTVDTYTIGDSGKIYKYMGGNSCTRIPMPSPTTKDLNAFVDMPSTPFIIVGDSGVIMKQFTLVSSPTTRDLRSVSYVGNNVVIANGTHGAMIRSSDNGNTWVNVNSGTTLTLNTVTPTAPPTIPPSTERDGEGKGSMILYASGENGILLRSFDLGLTWTESHFPAGQNGVPNINSMFFIDSQNGWATGDDGAMFKTNSGGFSWQVQPTSSNMDLKQVIFNSFSLGYAVGEGGTVLYTTNGGSNWDQHPVFDTLTTNTIHNFVKIDSVTFAAVGDNGTYIEIVTEQSTDPLENTRTIGPTGDFTSIGGAIAACDYLGIKGNVIFDIQPGTYNEQMVLPKILGTSFSKKIRFRSQSGNPNDVNLTFESFDNQENYTLLLDGAGHISFENLTISATDPARAHALEFRNTNTDISFTNVKFNGVLPNLRPGYRSASDQSVVETNINQYFTVISHVLFQGCTFDGGTNGLALSGVNPYSGNFDFKVYDCVFTNCDNGISMANNSQLDLINNTITAAITGLSFENCANFVARKNRINADNSCIEIHTCQSPFYSPGFVLNNFLTGKNAGIKLFDDNTYNLIYYNSINITDTDTASVPSSAGIETVSLTGSNNKIVSNIFVNKRKGYALKMTLSGSPFTYLDYNNYFSDGPNIANWNSNDCSDLNSFKSTSGFGFNSASVPVTFTSPLDLHLSGSSVGDTTLIGTPDNVFLEDIDGDSRDPNYPYMGADETAIVLPVELASFTANVNDRNVTLQWNTSHELNNSGFDIERSIVNNSPGSWEKIGFINGNGTVETPSNYSFFDHNLNSGSYKYRLKQIDFNGGFEYFNLQNEVKIGIPAKFDLSQNYPNPFNPSTKINYDLPFDGKVNIVVYDISGREAATLVNDFKNGGYYTVSFDASNLASGVYFYRISFDGNGNKFSLSKKMLLLK